MVLVDQKNQIAYLNVSTCNYSCLIFDKDIKDAHLKKENLLDNGRLEIWMFTCRITKLDPYLLPCTKLDSKCSKDLTVKLNY